MKEPIRKNLDHQPPHWATEASIYFITACAKSRKENHFCTPRIGAAIFDSIHYNHEKGRWYCHLAVLMTDHVHLLLSFPEIASFALVVGDWKRWLTRNHNISWQENFFEHRLRNEESANQKADYILQNPVRAGLVADFKDWPYFWMPTA